MWHKKRKEEIEQEKQEILLSKIDSLNKSLTENNIIDVVQILGNRKKLLLNNLIAGISRGVGIGIGVTIISAILVLILQRIVALNIPIIGKYATDIATIVQKSLRVLVIV